MSKGDHFRLEGEVTLDAFLGGKIMVLQPSSGYRAGLDAVVLAATVAATEPLRVLDLGAGVGTVGLCIAARLPKTEVVLLEREPALAALAQQNIARNGMAERVSVITADLNLPADSLGLAPEGFDHILANPPYQIEGNGNASPDGLKARSHAMPAGRLECWVRVMARLTKPGGTAAMIHRADALGEILMAFKGRFGGVIVLPLHPRPDEAAVRVIVRGIKGSRAPLAVMPGLVLHMPDGHGFTPLLQAILRDGQALSLKMSSTA